MIQETKKELRDSVSYLQASSSRFAEKRYIIILTLIMGFRKQTTENKCALEGDSLLCCLGSGLLWPCDLITAAINGVNSTIHAIEFCEC